MAQRSSIDRLPPEIRDEVALAIKRGDTIDQIVELLHERGALVSRSAVGRHSKQYSELAARQRDMGSVAAAFGKEFGEADDRQGRLMNQLLTSVITRAVLPIASGEEIDLGVKELGFLARAVKDATSSAKIDIDREAKIRDESSKRTRQAAAEAAETSAKAAGASDDTIRKVRAAILGIEA